MRSRILLATLLSASCCVGAAFALFQPFGSDGSDDRPSGRPPAQSEGIVASAESGASEASAAAGTKTAEALSYWPQWRGPLGTGVAPQSDPPIRWSEDHNVRWKVALPGKGHSTPIVWGAYVFLTAAVPYGEALPPRYSDRPGEHDNLPTTHRHEFVVLAIERENGEILWRRTVARDLPRETGHMTASLASNSPVTDGEHVYAFFGSRGLHCLDFAGNVKWTKDLGDMHTLHGHGEGASPALYGDLLVVNWDHEEQSFLFAFDKRTGRERWKVEREEPTSWATPVIIEQDGRPQVIVSGTNRIRGYDLTTGKVLWSCGGLSTNVVASPVAAGGMVYAGSSYDKRVMLGLRITGARGDLTGTDRVVWSRIRGAPYVPSPLLYDDALYFLNHYQNVLTRVDARSGEDQPGPMRLGPLGSMYASPVGAADRLYVTDLQGSTAVITHSKGPEILAVNRLDDTISASAAVAGRELFLRGARFLYCLAEPESSAE